MPSPEPGVFDIAATGFNTRSRPVTDRALDDVVSASEAIAAELKRIQGADRQWWPTDPGQGYLEIRPTASGRPGWESPGRRRGRTRSVASGAGNY